MNEHQKYLEQSIDLALSSIENGGGPFGAVVVKAGAIIATGKNEVVKRRDPTAHAEIVAIRNACRKLNNHQLNGCILYSSCEPCPMCLGALYWARIDALFYTLSRDDAAQAGFDDVFIYEEILLSPPERSLKSTQILIASREKIFKKWQEKTDKKTY